MKEVALPYGGDFSRTASGDLLMVTDTDTQFPALQQWFIQAILTSPLLQDASGNPILSSADDPFFPNDGAGARRLIGNTENATLVTRVESAILQIIALCPSLVAGQSPTIEFIVYPNGLSVTVPPLQVKGSSVPFVVPSISISPAGA